MGMISACCRQPDEYGRNRCSVSIQQAECAGNTYFMAAICVGHRSVSGEESGGYVAEQFTEWFWQEFVSIAKYGKHRVQKSLFGMCHRLHRKIQAQEERLSGRNRICKGGVSVEAVFLYGRRLYHVHIGSGSCCGIQKMWVRCLSRPHVIGENILLRTLGSCAWEQPELMTARLSKRESLLLGADHFSEVFQRRELARLWKAGSIVSEEAASLRLEEMCCKRKRQGEKKEQAVVIVLTNGRKESI